MHETRMEILYTNGSDPRTCSCAMLVGTEFNLQANACENKKTRRWFPVNCRKCEACREAAGLCLYYYFHGFLMDQFS